MNTKPWLLVSLISLSSALVSGCQHKPYRSHEDPYERINRFTFALNQDIDHLIARPATKVYDTITPPPLRRGVTNFFNNMDNLISIPNDLAQGKIRFVLLDAVRFLTNATIGIGGLFDTASALGMPKHKNDFGKTLAYYSSSKESPYLILPVLGPSTFRDAYGLIGQYAVNPTSYTGGDAIWLSYWMVDLLDQRSSVMHMNKLIDEAFDPYIAMRDAYLQHRRAQIKKNEEEPRLRHGKGHSYHPYMKKIETDDTWDPKG